MKFSERQKEIISDDSRLIAVVAGPGSGKTRVLVERINRLISEGHDPEGFVCITYTNAAAAEIAERLDGRLGYVGTLHGWCMRIINKVMKRRFSVIDEETFEYHCEKWKAAGSLKCTASDWKLALRNQRNWWITDEFTNYDAAHRIAGQLFSEQKKAGAIDFDSVLYLGLRCVINGEIEVGHLFVDEFQDTAEIDMRIYRHVRSESKFFIGDPNQSIFGFRTRFHGQEAFEILQERGFKVFGMTESFRCCEAICDAANDAIAENYKDDPNADLVKIVTADPAVEGEVAGVLNCPALDKEADAIAHLFRTYDLVPGETAVLVRTNKLVEEFSALLENRGIPVMAKITSLPQDWSIATAAIGYSAFPANDMMCHRVTTWRYGKPVADAALARSKAAYVFMNADKDAFAPFIRSDDHWWHRFLVLFSSETCTMVFDMIEKLEKTGREWTFDDLQMLMMNPDAGSFSELQRQENAVRVLTVHSAKGREWSSVFIPELNRDVWRGTVNENRRLLYVAITRAKRYAFLLAVEDDKRRPYSVLSEMAFDVG